MKYIYALIILVLINARIYAQDKDTLLLTGSDCGKSFDMQDKIEIHLSTLTSAGYNWYLSEDNPALNVSESYLKDSKLIGTEVIKVFLINTKSFKQHTDTNTSVNLDFVYKRNWEKDIVKKCQFILKYKN